MIINTLELINFRNYKKQFISFGDSINVIHGQNAQGKTNILEALYIAATGKSHRTNNYHDLINHFSHGFELSLTAIVSNRDTSIMISYSKEKGRLIEINGIKRNKLSDILGTLNMILFSPETLEVVKGPPQIRRKFLDVLLCQTNRQYLHSLQQYNILIKNKSVALKKGHNDKKYRDIIPIWNDSISKFGSIITFYRMKTIEKLNSFMKEQIEQITDKNEMSDLIYKTFCSFDIDSDKKEFEEELSRKLHDGLQKEIEIAQCIYGPHRDDFEILLNDLNSRKYCSQGQQRTLALSLILAEMLFLEFERGEKPVLLLDDVMSELDINRQEYLIKGLYDVQTILTTTNDLEYENIRNMDVKKFFVQSGHVYPKS